MNNLQLGYSQDPTNILHEFFIRQPTNDAKSE